MDLVVVGLGYVGLPVAREASAAGLSVVGFDLSERVIAGLMAGRSHVDDISDADVDALIDQGFSATDDPAVFSTAQTVVICVPTPLNADGVPDLSAIENTCRSLATRLTPGTLVVLESTTWPGTTAEFVRPILESSGLEAGRDFYLAFSPERIDPGNAVYGFRNTPKVVGGLTPACTAVARTFYSDLVDEVVVARGATEAEMTKLLENTYRHINIALVNEMAKFCHELSIDFWDVIRCAATKPFGFQAFQPGPGVGGHCIPIDPHYLSHRVRARLGYPFRFVELAQEINDSMPRYVAQRVAELLNNRSMALRGSRVLLLGVTYKPGIADQRESPVIPLAQELLRQGAVVDYFDPFVEEWTVNGVTRSRVPDVPGAVGTADVVVHLQPHPVYDWSRLTEIGTPILDTRGVLDGPHVERL